MKICLRKTSDLSGGFKGGWCWFQDPRAVRFVGERDRIYIGWANAGKIVVAYYDQKLRQEGTPHVIYDTGQNDDHIAPSLLILPDGRILIFWSKHGGDYIYMRDSVTPEDISEWREERIISGPDNNCCYTNPLRLASGRIYLFYRDCNNLNIKWIYSDDNAFNWSQPQVVIDFHNGRYNEAYIKVEAQGNIIHLAASACHHGEFDTYEHIYHAYFDGSNWRRYDGAILKLPLTPDNVEKVFDSGADNSWVWDIALDKIGHPAIAFSHKINTKNHQYWSVKYTSKGWQAEKIIDSNHGGLYEEEPAYSGGVYFNHTNPFQAYAAIREKNNFEIKKFEFAQGQWRKIKDITKNSDCWNIRPASPRNASEELEVLWMQGRYTSYKNYNTSIKYKETGSSIE